MDNFKVINLGCRVNAAETNQFAQHLLDSPSSQPTIFINTCAVTQKGEYESLAKVRLISKKYPDHRIIVSGCANLSKVDQLPNVTILPINGKNQFSSIYTPAIHDKFSQSKKYLLKIQSGCTHNCSYCIVPHRRTQLWSLPIITAINTINNATKNGYQHLIITGVNLAQYQPGLNSLLNSILTQTTIPHISFGSMPLICINDQFLKLIADNQSRFTNFLHIPIQSGSDKILKLMHRPYNHQQIISTIKSLKSKIKNLTLGTDIIVGFPSETDTDFQDTYDLCKQIGFTKIHTFRFSPRPDTKAWTLDRQSPVRQSDINQRSHLIRTLISQTKLPSRQKPES